MHDIYNHTPLPYMSVKLCPCCQKLTKVENDICEFCKYDFINKKAYEPLNSPAIEEVDEFATISDDSLDTTILTVREEPKEEKDEVKEEEEKEEKVEEEKVEVIAEENPKQDVEETTTIEVTDTVAIEMEKIVNIGKKRFFLIIEMIISGLLFFELLALPIVISSSSNFFEEVINGFAKIDHPTTINGYKAMKHILNVLFGGKESINDYKAILTVDGKTLLSSLPLFGKSMTYEKSLTIISILYFVSFIWLAMSFIVSFIGCFIKRNSKARMLGITTIILAVFTLVLISHSIKDAMEIIPLYLFFICFIYWFIYNIIFNKEFKKKK